MNGFFITGTGTEIGKTIATAILSFGLKTKGVNCCPLKPVASGGVWVEQKLVSEDAIKFKQISKIDEPLQTLNPFCLEYPASPHLAAEMQNLTIPIQWIQEEIQQTASRYEAVLIEGVGGWLVPIYSNMLVRDFARQLNLPVILVSSNILGTINHTLLTVESIRNSGQTLAGIVFTYPAPVEENLIHKDNITTIERLSEAPILGTIPHIQHELLMGNNPEQLWEFIKDMVQWNLLIQQLNLPPKK